MSQPAKPTTMAIPQPLAQALFDHILQAPTGGNSLQHANSLLDGLQKLQPVPQPEPVKVGDGS